MLIMIKAHCIRYRSSYFQYIYIFIHDTQFIYRYIFWSLIYYISSPEDVNDTKCINDKRQDKKQIQFSDAEKWSPSELYKINKFAVSRTSVSPLIYYSDNGEWDTDESLLEQYHKTNSQILYALVLRTFYLFGHFLSK